MASWIFAAIVVMSVALLVFKWWRHSVHRVPHTWMPEKKVVQQVNALPDLATLLPGILDRFAESGDDKEATEVIGHCKGECRAVDVERYGILHLVADHGGMGVEDYGYRVRELTDRVAQYVLLRHGRAYYWRKWFDDGEIDIEDDDDSDEDVLMRMFPLVGWLDSFEEQTAFLRTLTPIGAVRAAVHFALGPEAVGAYARTAADAVTTVDPSEELEELRCILEAGATVDGIRDAFARCSDRAVAVGDFMVAYRIASEYLKEGNAVRAVEHAWVMHCFQNKE